MRNNMPYLLLRCCRRRYATTTTTTTTTTATTKHSNTVISDRKSLSSLSTTRQHLHYNRYQQQQQSCSYSTLKSPSHRERFYYQVDVIETPESDSNKKVIDSPISAGVDGTDSASGVERSSKDNNIINNRMLIPRQPVSQLYYLVDSNNNSVCDDHENNNNNNIKWYSITLDNMILKTPMGKVLSVPNIELAYSIAVEWNSVKQYIKPLQMPFMTLSCTVIDQLTIQRENYIKQILQYFNTDTICYWADPTNADDRILYEKQQQYWKHIHEWIENDFCYNVPKPAQVYGSEEGMLFSTNKNSNNNKTLQQHIGLPHDDILRNACIEWVQGLNNWYLIALYISVSETKSFFLGVALILQQINIQQAQYACRVEEELQISNWGLVEGQHDYDRLNTSIQLSTASLLIQFINIINK